EQHGSTVPPAGDCPRSRPEQPRLDQTRPGTVPGHGPSSRVSIRPVQGRSPGYDRAMGYRFIARESMQFEERPYVEGRPPRLAADLTTAVGLTRSRARLWRYPPHT